jgi:hypothetical protein
MGKIHDENKDLRLLSKVLVVNVYNKTIEANKSQIIGNRRWARIDFLVNHCGWTFIWNNNVKVKSYIIETNNSDNKKKDKVKKMKEPKVNSKRK